MYAIFFDVSIDDISENSDTRYSSNIALIRVVSDIFCMNFVLIMCTVLLSAKPCSAESSESLFENKLVSTIIEKIVLFMCCVALVLSLLNCNSSFSEYKKYLASVYIPNVANCFKFM